MPHDSRDQLVDFVRSWSDKTDIPVKRFLPWLGIGASRFHDWKCRFGQVNEHNAWVPRDHWLKCGRSGNALDLWAQANRQAPYDAALDLCQRLNIPLPSLPSTHRNSEEEPVAPQSATCTMEST